MIEDKLVQPSCEYCRRLVHHKHTWEKGLERYTCFGERTIPSTAEPVDEYNFCVYSPFKGVVQFHVCPADLKFWMAFFLAARREITGEDMDWSTIEAEADMLFPRGNVN